MSHLIHKHLLISAKVNSPPLFNYSSNELNANIRKLIKLIDMKILSGPHSAYCNESGNEGWSSTAIITTSSITFHSWTELGQIELDVYSCREFDINTVFQWISQFEIEKLNYKYIDRELDFKEISSDSFDIWSNKKIDRMAS